MTTLILSSLIIAGVVLADEPGGTAMASHQAVLCEFTATVISLTELTNAPSFKGYVIHTDAHWQLVLDVRPHSSKAPFQTGPRTCWIRSVEDIFGVSAGQVEGEYRFTYLWNIAVPDKPEFEEFKAIKQTLQKNPPTVHGKPRLPRAGVEQDTAGTGIANGNIKALQPIVEKFLPEGYVLDVQRDQHDPYRWQSSGRFTGVTFYLKGDEAWQKREGKKRPCVYITFMPEAYDGKPASREDQWKFQVPSYSADFLGWRGHLRVYACRDFGYGLPDNGKLSENNLRKSLDIKKESNSQP